MKRRKKKKKDKKVSYTTKYQKYFIILVHFAILRGIKVTTSGSNMRYFHAFPRQEGWISRQ